MSGEAPRLDPPLSTGYEGSLEIARLKRALAEQAAELQEYKHRCERVQRFLSTRPEEVRRLGEAELADVIERDKRLSDAERRLKQREEVFARQQTELERVQLARVSEADQLNAALEAERRELAEKEKALQERFRKESAALQDETAKSRHDAETAAARAFDASKRAKDAEETIKVLTQKLRLAELEQAALKERVEIWEQKAREIEVSRQELKSERQRLATESAALEAARQDLEARAAQLERDHAQRREALDRLKERMRAEIDLLARQYQSRDKENA